MLLAWIRELYAVTPGELHIKERLCALFPSWAANFLMIRFDPGFFFLADGRYFRACKGDKRPQLEVNTLPLISRTDLLPKKISHEPHNFQRLSPPQFNMFLKRVASNCLC
jgi:hypothetical protein